MSPNNSICVENSNSGSNDKYSEHQVSKMDTLAGIAIKYGVEVADIRRLNNLVTDLQIFALKRLLIPLSGRHPPFSSLSNDSASSPNEAASPRECRNRKKARKGRSKILDIMQSLSIESPIQEVSPAMRQKYHQLKLLNPNVANEVIDMVASNTSVLDNVTSAMLPIALKFSDYFSSFRLMPQKWEDSLDENSAKGDYIPLAGCEEMECEKSVGRHQELEAASGMGSSERLLKEGNNCGNGGFSSPLGNCIAMKTKSASRTIVPDGPDSAMLNTISVGLGDSILSSGPCRVAKSSSLSSL